LVRTPRHTIGSVGSRKFAIEAASGKVAAILFHHFVINVENQKRGRPMPDAV
jgi:hypothetical protein